MTEKQNDLKSTSSSNSSVATKHISDADAEPPWDTAPDRQVGPQGPEMDREAKLAERAEQVKKAEDTAKAATPVIVEFNEHGGLKFGNHIQLANAAAIAMKLPNMPAHLKKEGVEAVRAALVFINQHRLPLDSCNELMFVRGKLSAFGTLFSALASRHPNYGDKRVFFLDEEQNRICMDNKNLKSPVWACVVQVKPQDHESWDEFFFTIEMAKTAGLLSNDTYRKYPGDMLYHKANARALKTHYSTAIHGIEYYEDIREVHETAGAREVSETKDLNDAY